MNRLGLFMALAWRNLWRNYRRTLITFASITVGVWSMISLAAFMDAWAMSTFNASIKTLTGHGQIHSKKYLDDPSVEHRFLVSAALKKHLNNRDVSAWASRVRVPAIVQSERETAPITLLGIEAEKEKGLSFIADSIHEGRYLKNNNEPGILLGNKLAERLHTRLHKRVVILTQAADGSIAERGFRVIGIFRAEQQQTETQFVFISIGQAQGLLQIQQDISEIAFTLHLLDKLPAFIHQLKKTFTQLDIKSWDELEPFTKAILDMSTGTIALWTVIMFILIAFGLLNTLLMAVFERSREFGLFQALGMQPKYILLQVLLESLLLIGLGVIAGVISGILTIMYFHQGLDLGILAEGAALFGAGRIMYPQLNPFQITSIALFVWLMGIISSLYPAWLAAREVPVATINKSY